MKVRIPKRQLLRQLPSVVAAQLVSCNDLPDYFDFDVFGTPQDKAELDELSRMRGKFPRVAAALTPMEWFMFATMAKQHPQPAPKAILTKFLKNRSDASNNVAGHVMRLRKSLKKHKLPFDVVAIRGGVTGTGSYRLVKKS